MSKHRRDNLGSVVGRRWPTYLGSNLVSQLLQLMDSKLKVDAKGRLWLDLQVPLMTPLLSVIPLEHAPSGENRLLFPSLSFPHSPEGISHAYFGESRFGWALFLFIFMAPAT